MNWRAAARFMGMRIGSSVTSQKTTTSGKTIKSGLIHSKNWTARPTPSATMGNWWRSAVIDRLFIALKIGLGMITFGGGLAVLAKSIEYHESNVTLLLAALCTLLGLFFICEGSY